MPKFWIEVNQTGYDAIRSPVEAESEADVREGLKNPESSVYRTLLINSRIPGDQSWVVEVQDIPDEKIKITKIPHS